MKTDRIMERFLETTIQPIQPRRSYISSLRDRLLHGRRMVVEVEPAGKVQEAVTLATVGLGVVATVAALATLGFQLAGRVAQAGTLTHQKSIHSSKP